MPLLALAATAYRDLARTLQMLWPLVVLASLINFAALVAERIVLWALILPATGRELAGLIIGLTATVLLAPFWVAVHRFILRGETTGRYWNPADQPRIAAVTAWLMAYTYAATTPAFLLHIAPGGTLSASGAGLVLIMVLLVLMLRLIILIPAIAVDAPGATWENVFRDTHGHAWYILGAIVVPLLPFLGMTMLFLGLAGPGDGMAKTFFVDSGIAFLTTVEVTLGIILMSRLYEMLGDQVNRRPCE